MKSTAVVVAKPPVDGLPPRPGRPRKYEDLADARAARAIARREAREAAIASGLVRATVLVPAGQLKNIKAIAKSMRDASRAIRRQAGIDHKKPRKEERTTGRPFGAAEQAVVLRAWREGGTLDDLKAAGIDIDQACTWLVIKGEAGSAAEAYRQLLHETNLVRQLEMRDGMIAIGRAALPSVRSGQAAHRPKAAASADEQLLKFDDRDNGGDGDDESWPGRSPGRHLKLSTEIGVCC